MRRRTVQAGQKIVTVGGLAWLAAAVLAGGLGLVRSLRPPAPQAILLGLTLALLALGTWQRSLRAWAFAVDPRRLVALHLTRFVGFYFLYLYGRGELPYDFAVLGGWGDIVVAALALPLLFLGPPDVPWRRWAYLGWNALGLTDILFVVATAARLATADPDSMRALLRLPLSLLPTFLVPLIIATHVLIFIRLLPPARRDEARQS